MLTVGHEVLVDLFRNRPALAIELLRATSHVDLHGQGVVARTGAIDLSEVVPPEFRCDALIEIYEHGSSPVKGRLRPSAAIIVEVQRSRDAAKRRSWPAYVTVAARRLRCPVYLLVLATKPVVARWAARSISLGHPGFCLNPIVLDFEHLPRADQAVARAVPELAVLSALGHRDAETAEVALLAMASLPDNLQKLYWDLILATLPDTARQVLEAMMLKKYEYQSDFARKYYGEGREEGREEGRQEGRRGERYSIVREQLIVKFGALPPEIDARLAAASYAELGDLAKRLLVADSIDTVFGDS